MMVGLLIGFVFSGFSNAEDIRFPEDPGILNVKAAPYNAKGDGTTDDTAAIQAAISDELGKRGFVYLPNGTYKLSDSLVWKSREGKWWARLVLRGQSRDGVVLKLIDKAVGFHDKNAPKGVIITASESPFEDGGNNQGFQNSIRNLTINTGSGNDGAVGVDYLVSNQGSLKDLKIIAGDGEGYAGVRMARAYPGPGLLKNIDITGFDYGARQTHQDYSMTYDTIVLKNQKIAGLYIEAMASMYNITSTNQVPALQCMKGVTMLLKADLNGGSATNPGCRIGGEGRLDLQDVRINGYGNAIEDAASATKGVAMNGKATVIKEYLSLPPQSLFESPAQMLHLPIEEAPVYVDGDPKAWANIKDYGAIPCSWGASEHAGDSTEAIQKAMDSGKATVFIGGGDVFYRINKTITIPPTVRHLVGTNRNFVSSGDFFNNHAEPKSVFKAIGDSSNPLIVETLDVGLTNLGAIGFEQATKRTIVFMQCGIPGDVGIISFHNTVTGGKVFAEDVMGGRWLVTGPQQMWARQFNTEYGDPKSPCITLRGSGATAWILGMKTENSPGMNLLTLEKGATAEVLGLYAFNNHWEPDMPMIINNEGNLVIQWWMAGQTSFKIQVRETRDGVTKDMAEKWQLQPLYTGYKKTQISPAAKP